MLEILWLVLPTNNNGGGARVACGAIVGVDGGDEDEFVLWADAEDCRGWNNWWKDWDLARRTLDEAVADKTICDGWCGWVKDWVSLLCDVLLWLVDIMI